MKWTTKSFPLRNLRRGDCLHCKQKYLFCLSSRWLGSNDDDGSSKSPPALSASRSSCMCLCLSFRFPPAIGNNLLSSGPPAIVTVNRQLWLLSLLILFTRLRIFMRFRSRHRRFYFWYLNPFYGNRKLSSVQMFMVSTMVAIMAIVIMSVDEALAEGSEQRQDNRKASWRSGWGCFNLPIRCIALSLCSRLWSITSALQTTPSNNLPA